MKRPGSPLYSLGDGTQRSQHSPRLCEEQPGPPDSLVATSVTLLILGPEGLATTSLENPSVEGPRSPDKRLDVMQVAEAASWQGRSRHSGAGSPPAPPPIWPQGPCRTRGQAGLFVASQSPAWEPGQGREASPTPGCAQGAWWTAPFPKPPHQSIHLQPQWLYLDNRDTLLTPRPEPGKRPCVWPRSLVWVCHPITSLIASPWIVACLKAQLPQL